MVRLCDVDDFAWPMGDGIGAEAEGCRGWQTTDGDYLDITGSRAGHFGL
jgi:hypothetical protein